MEVSTGFLFPSFRKCLDADTVPIRTTPRAMLQQLPHPLLDERIIGFLRLSSLFNRFVLQSVIPLPLHPSLITKKNTSSFWTLVACSTLWSLYVSNWLVFLWGNERLLFESDSGWVVRLLWRSTVLYTAAGLNLAFIPLLPYGLMASRITLNAPLYAENPDWADVTPQAQYENVNPLAPIFYTEECS